MSHCLAVFFHKTVETILASTVVDKVKIAQKSIPLDLKRSALEMRMAKILLIKMREQMGTSEAWLRWTLAFAKTNLLNPASTCRPEVIRRYLGGTKCLRMNKC
jgi:hypothetical protein